ncbi:MAG: acetyl-CoA carboxylase biotin carboxyl carrier protein subunit [Bacteroidales bacterium]
MEHHENIEGNAPENFFNLIVDEAEYRTLPNRMYERRKPYEPYNPAKIKSFMPGNIPEIFVKAGDEIKEGDRLLILEAMKMKNIILAPFDGKVKKINVSIGEMVPKNHVLIELK